MIQPKAIRGRISRRTIEAPGVVTFRIDLGGERFEYRPGMAVNVDPHQFPALAVRISELEQGGMVMDRSFSLASTPLEPGFIEITVKQENGQPLLTPYLVDRLREGDAIEFSGPFGKFTLPEPLPGGVTGVLHVVAGSGIAPCRGILRHCLMAGLPLRHLMLAQNRRPEDIIYRAELQELGRTHANRFKVVHVISRPQESAERWSGRTGYITAELIREEASECVDLGACLAFVCGPNKPRGSELGFIDRYAGVKRKNQPGVLGSLGIPFERIVVETW